MSLLFNTILLAETIQIMHEHTDLPLSRDDFNTTLINMHQRCMISFF